MANHSNTLSRGTVLHGPGHEYRIEQVLGQGAFGITYLAKMKVHGKLGNLEMAVAVKEFFMCGVNGRNGNLVTVADKNGYFEKYLRKFANEARKLGTLKHNGIIKVLETFEANGTSYYSMEYCEGGSLSTMILQQGALPQDAALRYFQQIAIALSYMHRRKMLHLDLKPDNIIMRKSGEAVIIDFGLSKQYDSNGVPESSSSIGGGTPGFAPIEQMNYDEGRGFPVTIDVYALGATLFTMLTGTTPPAAASVNEEGLPVERLVSRGIPSGTIECITRAMQPRKKDRFQSVDEFAAALNIQLAPSSASIPMGGKTKIIATNKSILRSRGVYAAIIAAVGLAIAVSFTFWQLQKPTAPISDAGQEAGDTVAVVQVEDGNASQQSQEAEIDETMPPMPARPHGTSSNSPQSATTAQPQQPVIIEEPEPPTDDERFAASLHSNDIKTLTELGNKGYEKAYVPLAKYYHDLNTAEGDAICDYWCKKAKQAGNNEVDVFIKNLEIRGFYD